MDFFNDTSLDSHLARAQLFFKDLLQAVVVVKGSFDVLPSGETTPSAEPSPVLAEDTDTPYGTLEAEVVPVKAWCDLALLGHAYSPRGRPVSAMTVALQVGDFRRAVRVTGDRIWQKSMLGLHPSDAVPFTKLPLDYRHAYGGVARQEDDIPLPFFDNPAGRGFALLREHVAGMPLPNIEELDQPIQAWSDRPPPAGFAPLGRQMMARGNRGVTVDLERYTSRVDGSAFCFAHPRMNVPAYPHGALVTVDGATEDGRWRFRLPELRPWISIRLGACRYELPLAIDTVYLLPDQRRVTVVARRTFIYQLIPERKRSVRVFHEAQMPPATGDPLTTVRALRAAPSAEVPLTIESPDQMTISMEALAQAHPMIDLIEGFPLCASG